MSTGATDEQLVNAAQRLCGGQPEDVGYCWPDSDLREVASVLVPPGQVIVDAARVPTDDELAAMRLIVSRAPVPEADWFDAIDVLTDYLERQR